MSIEITNVQRLRVYEEPAGSFATDHTGTLGDFLDVPFIEGSLTASIEREMLNPDHAQQNIDGYPTQVLGIKACKLSFSMNLAPTGTAAGNATAAVQGALGRILKAVMGSETLGTGTTVNDATAAATDFDLTDATGVTHGTAVGFVKDNGYFQARPIKTKSSTNVLMRLNFSEAPDNTDVAYASATYWLSEDPTSSLQFILEGYESQNRWLFRGLQLESMSLEVPLGQLPRITFSFMGAAWTYGASAATDLTASALALASYTNVSVIHTVGDFLYQTYNTVTNPTALDVSATTYEPALSYTAQTSPSADAGGEHVTKRYRRVRQAPVISGSFTLPYQDTTYFTDRDNKTLKQMWYQLGVTAGQVVCLDIPKAQIVDVQKGDANQIDSQVVSWAAQLDDQTTGGSNLAKSPFRIHLL